MPCEAPLIIVEPVKSALRVAALNDAAADLGLKRGMPLADARAMYPSIKIENGNPQADSALLDNIADWCDRYTPLAGLDPPDGLLLDVSGCAHLFGGERAMGRDLLTRLSQQGLQARIGFADSPGCAWAVARYGATLLVPERMAREVLLPLPLAALRLDSETVSALAQVGLKCIADVIDRPRAPLAARFGEKFLRRLDQALGREDESIKPRLPLPRYMAERRFPDPIALQADVLGTIKQLACELGHIMERHGEGVRSLQVVLFRADGKVYRLAAGTCEPLRDPERIHRLFIERLTPVAEACDPGFGYDVIRLSALVSERLDPAQQGLAGNDQRIELAHLIDRLSARFDARRVMRLIPHDTHIPEHAVAAVPAQLAQDGFAAAPGEQDSLAPIRPLRLFAPPESIETVAEVPDGPPVRFRWRHVLHDVVAAEGPERVAMEWWRNGAPARDYFRVESRRGMRAWLYREGLYGEKTGKPCWFLHGLFA